MVMEKHLLLNYLDCRNLPMARCVDAVALHQALCEAAPDFYVHLLADSEADLSQKREVLSNVLTRSAAQHIERQHLLTLLCRLSLAEAVGVLGVIQERRINRSRARELVLAYLLGHEELPALAAVRRQRLARLLRHVLGERTWSSVKRFLASSTPEGEQFLQREVFCYAGNNDVARLREVLCFLTGVPFTPTVAELVKSMGARQAVERGEGLPAETLTGLRGIYHRKTPLRTVRRLAAPAPVTTREDGLLTAKYKEVLAHGAETPLAAAPGSGPFAKLFKVFGARKVSPEEGQGLPVSGFGAPALLAQAGADLPRIEGRLAIVLDLSLSMVSSGERLYHPAALGLALTTLLRSYVSEVRFYQAGGSGALEQDGLPRPQGTADMALALLEAVRHDPQMILLITDGYENLRQGDTAQVVEGLRQLGQEMPVYQVVPLFTMAENLEQRRLGESIPVIPIAHEEGVRELLARVLLISTGEQIAPGELGQLQQLLTVR